MKGQIDAINWADDGSGAMILTVRVHRNTYCPQKPVRGDYIPEWMEKSTEDYKDRLEEAKKEYAEAVARNNQYRRTYFETNNQFDSFHMGDVEISQPLFVPKEFNETAVEEDDED